MRAVIDNYLRCLSAILFALGSLWLIAKTQQPQRAWERAHHCTVTATYGPGPYETNSRIETLTCDGGVKTWRYAE